MLNTIEYKIKEAALTMQEGGVIICPTEGVFGISALVHNQKAIERIIHIKKRALNKGLIVVASHVSMLDSIVDFSQLNQDSMALLRQCWPGHATFIVPAKKTVVDILTGGRTTLAVRVTAFPLLAKLCDETQSPIVSTSANLSGSAPLETLQEIHSCFAHKVDYILDEPCQGLNRPSTIYDAVTGNILRQ